MYTDEQLQAWTRLKLHLAETQKLLLNVVEKDDADPTMAQGAIIICEDIDEQINILEKLFII